MYNPVVHTTASLKIVRYHDEAQIDPIWWNVVGHAGTDGFSGFNG